LLDLFILRLFYWCRFTSKHSFIYYTSSIY